MTRRARAALFAACLLQTSHTFATTRSYDGPDFGSWSTNTNWSGNVVPGTNDDAFFGTISAGTTDLHLTLDTIVTVNSLTINSSGIGGTAFFTQISANSGLTAATVNIGTSVALNAFAQTAGTNAINTLNVGNTSTGNSYTLSNTGVLNSVAQYVGLSGSGTFVQSNGTNTVSTGNGAFPYAPLNLGVNAGSIGTYNLTAGTLNGAYIGVAMAGTGTFNQSGGTNNAVSINIGTNSGTGVYNYSGGTITSAYPTVGLHGTFNLTGNVPSIPAIGSAGGVFHLNGHNLSVGGITSSNFTSGVLNTSGGNATFTLNQTFSFGNLYGSSTVGFALQDGLNGQLSFTITNGQAALYSTSNTYSGSTTLSGNGVLVAGAANSLSPNSAVSISGGGKLIVASSGTVASIAGTGGTIDFGVGGNTLTVGGNNTSTNSASVIKGEGNLTKIGSGALTLTNNNSDLSGTITVQGGTLTNGIPNGIPTASAVVLGAGTTLSLNYDQTLPSLNGPSSALLSLASGVTLSVGTDGTFSEFDGAIIGSGTVYKVGTGTLQLGSSTGNASAGVSYFAIFGNIVVAKTPGTPAMSGTVYLGGGNVICQSSNNFGPFTQVSLSQGTFDISNTTQSILSLSGGVGTLALGTGTLTVNPTSPTSFGGPITATTGTLIKAGPADMTITGSSSSANYVVNAGKLIIVSSFAPTGTFTANSGGTLRFDSGNLTLGTVTLRANAGGTVEYLNSTINGGFLRGTGTHSILAGGSSTFNGVTTFTSTSLLQSGSATLNNFSNGGTLTSNAPLLLDGVVNTVSGNIILNSTSTARDLTSVGQLTLNPGAVMTNDLSPLYIGGGGRFSLGSKASFGGTLNLTNGTTLELDGALLTNNGTINGTVNINYGATAKGAGTFSTVNVNDGGKFSPGNSPGSVTTGSANWNGGGGYLVEINDATGSAGTGYDTWNINGNLTVGAGNTTPSKFVISLASLSTPTTAGLTSNFNPAVNNTFLIAHTTGSILNFDPSRFIIDTSGFLNPLPSTAFTVSQVGQNLYVSNGPPSLTVPTTLVAGQVKLTSLTVTGLATLDAGSGHASEITTLSMPGNGAGSFLGFTNLVDSDLLLHTGSEASVRSLIKAWYNNGARNGLGLGASYAGTNSPAASLLTLAVVTNTNLLGKGSTATFDGLATSQGDLLIKFTYLGDTNLDGRVNVDDLNALVLGLQDTSLTGWRNGDLNYDGAINLADLALLQTSMASQGAPFADSFAAGASGAVPEPGSLGVLSLLALPMLRRVRR